MTTYKEQISKRLSMTLDVTRDIYRETRYDVSVGGFSEFSFSDNEIKALARLLHKAGVLNQAIEEPTHE
jgi:hypothetical protein